MKFDPQLKLNVSFSCVIYSQLVLILLTYLLSFQPASAARRNENDLK